MLDIGHADAFLLVKTSTVSRFSGSPFLRVMVQPFSQPVYVTVKGLPFSTLKDELVITGLASTAAAKARTALTVVFIVDRMYAVLCLITKASATNDVRWSVQVRLRRNLLLQGTNCHRSKDQEVESQQAERAGITYQIVMAVPTRQWNL